MQDTTGRMLESSSWCINVKLTKVANCPAAMEENVFNFRK